MRRLLFVITLVSTVFAQTSNYPGSLDTDTSLFVTADNVQSILNVAMAPGDSVAVIQSCSPVTACGFATNMIATVCDTTVSVASGVTKCTAWEHMLVTGVSGNQLTLTRGAVGTSARSHASGAVISVLIDSAHQKSLKSAVIAVETLLGPNGSNLTSSPIVPASKYNFSPQTPGGSLSIGNNVVNVAPCPLGVNGTDANHYLYVSGGVGTAEAPLITGGTCTSGATSGTVILNCANTHSGAWTVASATGGAAEAQQYVVTSLGGYGTVEFTSPVTFYAGVYAISGSGMITWRGNGDYSSTVTRASSYTAGDLFQNLGGSVIWAFERMFFTGGAFTSTGANLHLRGLILVDDVQMYDGQFGIEVEAANGGHICDVIYTQTYYGAKPIAAFYFGNVGVQGSNNLSVRGLMVNGGTPTSTNAVGAGLYFRGTDTVEVTNSSISGGSTGIYFDNTVANAPNINSVLSNIVVIDVQGDGIAFIGNASTMANIAFSNLSVLGDYSGPGTLGQGAGINMGVNGATTLDNVSFTDLGVAGFALSGVMLKVTGAKNISFGGNCRIWDNNQSNTSGYSGIYNLVTGITGLNVSNCRFFNVTGHQKFGINQSTGTLSGTITGNTFDTSLETGPVSPGTFSGVMVNNKGIDDTSTAIASAATLAFPVGPNFTVTGTTGVTAVSGLWAGRVGTLITTGGAVAFTSGATIGNSCTTTQNKPYTYYFDGTRIWIAGAGC